MSKGLLYVGIPSPTTPLIQPATFKNTTISKLKSVSICLVSWSDHLVLKWSARVLRMVQARMALLMIQSCSIHPLQSAQSTGIWTVVAGKMYMRLQRFHLSWPEQVLFGQPEWTNNDFYDGNLLIKTLQAPKISMTNSHVRCIF